MTDVAAEAPAQTDEAAAQDAKPAAESGTPAAEAKPSADQPAAETGDSDGVRARAAGFANDLADKASDAMDKAGEAVEATKDAASRAVTRMRNSATLSASRGHTTIANEVVEKIAGIAAREVPGVYDLGGDVARIFSAVKDRLHLGEENAAQGISVRLEGKQAEIEVVIVIEFGFQVYSVTEKVREKVVSSVESMLGLEVTAVNVNVDDVHIDNDSAPGNDAERAVGYSAETTAIVVGAPAEG
ncbi:hypothetical protein GCM10023322_19060 [Rugosimonospora acidiphila]|uniref:Asp23/Gls24 family envelope stress response protein n=1 Tax=Rugosimonospora acidiphila TaxID=556531 RepID=A0ABP9RQH3_9ACTN